MHSVPIKFAPHTFDREAIPPQSHQWRNLEFGSVIPLPSGYVDQPYMVRANDGAIVMISTTSNGGEGTEGQHVISLRSTDDGRTWTTPVALEPPDGVEASYGVIIKAPGGRLFSFYNHNTDDIRKVAGDRNAYPDGWCRRVDSLGHFVFKFSDDHGISWSKKRYPISVREFAIDRENTSGGKIRYFWNVGRAFWRGDDAYIPMHKVGGFGVDFFTRSEGCLLRSSNLISEPDPEKIRFDTLPDGDIGIRPPEGAGPIGEEHSFTVLSDGGIFVVFRTVSGYAARAYSRDGGASWSNSQLLSYPSGRPVKNPRAANFIWKLSSGRFLYWFHNHSGRSYADRNPVWCLAAREIETPEGIELEFSQPEILLYASEMTRRMSYPDCLELDGGDLLLTETEKQTGRAHRIPASFINGITHQWERPPVPDESDLIGSWERGSGSSTSSVSLPVLYDREGGWEMISGSDLHNGFSFVIDLEAFTDPGVILENRGKGGRGLALTLSTDRRIRLSMNDGRSESHWEFSAKLEPSIPHHLVIIVDGGPKIMIGVIDGHFDDGGEADQFGFGSYHPFLQSANGLPELSIGNGVRRCSVYRRALLTCEAVALYQLSEER